MKPVDKSITPGQYMLLVTSFVVGSVLLISFMDNMVRQDSWLVVLMAIFAMAPFLLTYVMLAKRLPGKNLMEINDAVFGPALGKVMSLAYLGYIFILLSFNMSDLADFYIGSVMPDTPKAALVIFTLLVAGYAVHKGLHAIARVGLVAFAYTVFVVTITFFLLIKDMNFSNFLPMLEAPLDRFVQSTHVFAGLPYGETFVFLMFLPMVNPGGKIGRNTFAGVLMGMLLLIIISVRNTAVLGPTSALFSTNSYMAVRLIDIGGFLTRVELLVAVSILVVLFTKIIVLFAALVKGLTALLGLRSGSPLILPVGALAALLALIAFSSTVGHSYAGMRYHPYFPLLCEFLLPPVTLLVAALRGIGRESSHGS